MQISAVLEKNLFHFCCRNFVMPSSGVTLMRQIILIKLFFIVFFRCFANTVKSNTVSRQIEKFQQQPE